MMTIFSFAILFPTYRDLLSTDVKTTSNAKVHFSTECKKRAKPFERFKCADAYVDTAFFYTFHYTSSSTFLMRFLFSPHSFILLDNIKWCGLGFGCQFLKELLWIFFQVLCCTFFCFTLIHVVKMICTMYLVINLYYNFLFFFIPFFNIFDYVLC